MYCRLYLGTKKEISEYDRMLEEQVNGFFQGLEAKSKDYFEITDEKYKEGFESFEKVKEIKE